MVSQVLSAEQNAKYQHIGKSGRVYKSDHALSKHERRQIDKYDAEVEMPKRAAAQKSTLATYFKAQSEDKTNVKGPMSPVVKKEADRQTQETRAKHMDRPKVEPWTSAIGTEIAARSQEAIGKAIRPVTDLVGQASLIGKDLTNQIAAGAINTPINIFSNAANLMTEVGEGNFKDAAKSTANIAVDVAPIKVKPIIKAAKTTVEAAQAAKAGGIKSVPAQMKAAKAIGETLESGVKGAKVVNPKARTVAVPKGPSITQEERIKPPPPKAEPKPAPKAKPVQAPEPPKATGVSHAEVEKLRTEGLIDKPRQVSRKADAELITQSKNHVGKENSLANEILDTDSTKTLADSEALALGKKLNSLVEDMRTARKANDEDAFFKANADAERIANALDESGTRQGRALRARQFLFENEVDPWIVERKARKSGASEKEIKSLKELAEKNQEEIRKILPDWDPEVESIQTALNRRVATDLEKAKAEAGIEIVFEGVKRKSGNRTIEAVKAEREAQSKLIKDLVKKTFKESMTVGPQSGGLQSFFENAPEVFKALRKYIELMIEERKIAKLDDLYQPAKEDIHRMLKEEMGDDLPDDFEVTDSDVRAVFSKFYESSTRSPGQVTNQLNELRTQAGLVENIERVTNGLDAIKGKSPKQASREVQKLRSQLNELLSKVGQSPAQSGVRTRLQNLIEKLKADKASGARPNPKEQAKLFEDLKKEIQSLRKDMRLEDTIDDLQSQLREGTFKPPSKKVAQLTKEQERMQYQVEKLRGEVRGKLQAAQEPKGLRTAIEILNTPRTLLSTGDVSWIFRQAIKTTVANPKRGIKDLGHALLGGVSEQQAYKILRDMEATDAYMLADRAGVRFEDFRPGGARNEAFLANWIGKFPVVGSVKKFSERNYVIGLNKARLGMFEDFLKNARNATKEEMSTWARYINDATGSGELGKMSQAASELAAGFFSPRLLASRIRSPLYVFNKNAKVRNRAISDVVKLAAAGNTALAIAHANGAEVTLDPDDADFGKIRIGNQATDIWGGYQQPLRTTARLAKAIAERLSLIEAEKVKTGPNRGKAKTLDPWDLAEQYLSYKLAPGVQAGRTMVIGKNAVGEDVTLGKFLESLVEPLNIQGTKESAELNQWLSLKTGWSFIGNSSGFGVSTYEKKQTK